MRLLVWSTRIFVLRRWINPGGPMRLVADALKASLHLRALVAGLLLGSPLVAGAQRADAQSVAGTVRDETTRLPLSGAVVSGITRSDSLVANTISTARGAFAFLRPTSPIAAVRVIHIGYRPATVPVLSDSPVDVRLERLPLTLPAVAVDDRSECPRRDDARLAAMLWSQAQDALLAAVVARKSAPATMRIVRYYRTIDRGHAMLPGLDHGGRDRVDTQSTRLTTEIGSRVFAAARPASYFAQHGYVARSGDGYVIFGPDEEVLLDSSFARTHCFHLAKDGDHRGQIGVVFEPTRGRDSVTDLVGTLWIDSAQAALRSVQYIYTDFHMRDVNADGSGGFMAFATAANGIPIMVSWRLMEPQRPAEGQFAQQGARGGGRGLGIVVRLHPEMGAQLASAAWDDGTVWSAPLASTEGVVIDPDSKKPRAGVPVRLLNADRLTWTDSVGRFHFDDLIAGPYLFAVEDTLLAVFRTLVNASEPRIKGAKPSQALGDWVKRVNKRFDSQPVVQAIQVDSAPNPEITVELPTVDGAFRRACGREIKTDSSGILAAWVLSGDVAADGATIVARWRDGPAFIERTVRADDQGRAIICGPPRGDTVSLYTTLRDGSPATTAVRILPDRLVTIGVVQLR